MLPGEHHHNVDLPSRSPRVHAGILRAKTLCSQRALLQCKAQASCFQEALFDNLQYGSQTAGRGKAGLSLQEAEGVRQSFTSRACQGVAG